MGSDVAAFGSLDFTKKTMAAWKRLDATPSRMKWRDFGAASDFQGTVSDALDLLREPPGAWAWELDVGGTALTLRGVLAGDAFDDHARLLALVWIRAGEAGGTGTLHLRGFETSDYGATISAPAEGASPFAPRAMSAAQKKAADDSDEMASLQAAIAELAELAPAPTKKKAAKKRAGGAAKPTAARSAEALVEATADGKSKDRVAALAELVTVDPVAAEKVTLSWLAQPVIGDERLYALVNAAAETAGKLGTRPCIERIVRLVHEGLPEYGAFASKKALAATTSPATAAIILATLGDAAIVKRVSDSLALLAILVERGHAGDHARLRAIHDDAARLGSEMKDLPPAMQDHWADALRAVTETLLALPE